MPLFVFTVDLGRDARPTYVGVVTAVDFDKPATRAYHVARRLRRAVDVWRACDDGSTVYSGRVHVDGGVDLAGDRDSTPRAPDVEGVRALVEVEAAS